MTNDHDFNSSLGKGSLEVENRALYKANRTCTLKPQNIRYELLGKEIFAKIVKGVKNELPSNASYLLPPPCFFHIFHAISS